MPDGVPLAALTAAVSRTLVPAGGATKSVTRVVVVVAGEVGGAVAGALPPPQPLSSDIANVKIANDGQRPGTLPRTATQQPRGFMDAIPYLYATRQSGVSKRKGQPAKAALSYCALWLRACRPP